MTVFYLIWFRKTQIQLYNIIQLKIAYIVINYDYFLKKYNKHPREKS